MQLQAAQTVARFENRPLAPNHVDRLIRLRKSAMSDMRQVDEEGVHMNDAEGRVLLCVAPPIQRPDPAKQLDRLSLLVRLYIVCISLSAGRSAVEKRCTHYAARPGRGDYCTGKASARGVGTRESELGTNEGAGIAGEPVV